MGGVDAEVLGVPLQGVVHREDQVDHVGLLWSRKIYIQEKKKIKLN